MQLSCTKESKANASIDSVNNVLNNSGNGEESSCHQDFKIRTNKSSPLHEPFVGCRVNARPPSSSQI